MHPELPKWIAYATAATVGACFMLAALAPLSRIPAVATSRIVHATPAAFAAHRTNRSSYEQIARDMHGAGVDVMLGAGSRYFQEREDGADLLAAMAEKGYAVAKTAPEVRAAVDARWCELK